jgi:diacylglycerol kinase family enzyme
VACGGDGTLHEVVNGLMLRNDKKRIHIGIIPNGSGNDFCADIRITNVDRALDYIISGDLIHLDVTKTLIDFETEEEIPNNLRD